MDIKIIGVLDATHHLLELVPKVLPALVRHHKVMLKHNGHTLPDHVPSKGSLGLRQDPGSRLIGDPARHALIK